MTTIASTHGLGAISDPISNFKITRKGSGAVISPTDVNQLSGWIYFSIPGQPATNPNLKKVMVECTSSDAAVETLSINLGREEVFSRGNLNKSNSFDLAIDEGERAAHIENGIVVSIELKFENQTANMEIQSVAIEF